MLSSVRLILAGSLLCVGLGFYWNTASVRGQSPGTPPAESAPPTLEQAVRSAAQALATLENARPDDDRDALSTAAKQAIEGVKQVDPTTPWLHYLDAQWLALTGRETDAIGRLRVFLETREGRNEWRAFKLLGDLYVQQYPRLALAEYERAAALQPGEPGVLMGLSRCAGLLGQKDRAADLARDAAAADGGRTLAYVDHLARAMTSARRWHEAREASRDALRLAEQACEPAPARRDALQVLDAQLKLAIDILYLSAQKETEARRLSESYVQLADLGRRRAENGIRLSAFDLLDVLEEGVRRAGSDASADLVARYAVTLTDVGRTAEAITQFERLLTLDPASTLAAEHLERLRASAPSPPDATRP